MACKFAAGGTFAGTFQEVQGNELYYIIYKGTFTGSAGYGEEFVHGRHEAWSGQGRLWSRFEGLLNVLGAAPPFPAPGTGGPSAGGEYFRAYAHANNYTGVDAVAVWPQVPGPVPGPALPLPVNGYNETWGIYETSTDLWGTMSYNAGAGQQFDFRATGYLGEVVPEPASVVLLGIALLALAGRMSGLARRNP